MKTLPTPQPTPTVSQFPAFSTAIHAHFTALSTHELFVVDLSPDTIWETYLSAFPPGTNPIFRERTEHDCSCCRQFIRAVGNVIAIIDGEIKTIWDVEAPEPYSAVASTLSALIRSVPIRTIFRTVESRIGTPHNIEYLLDGATIKWEHFHCAIASRHRSTNAATQRSVAESTVGVIQRGFDELAPQAVRDVLELVSSNSLYRGVQYKKQLEEFAEAQTHYLANSPRMRNLLVWNFHANPALAVRSSAIGTLLIDLSTSVPIEKAVRKFEAMVAPANYRRSSAPITNAMIEQALTTLDSLSLRDAVARRHATFSDISTQDVLWVNRPAGRHMRDPLEDLLTPEAQRRRPANPSTQEIPIADFLQQILPHAIRLEALITTQHSGNFMSLTAPLHTTSPPLFAWSNPFAWSYAGNLTDSIKERVKRAGGDVTGLLRFSLAWHNTDDLDLHATEPSGFHIFFGQKRSTSGGTLDVDMNVGHPLVRDAVENITWPRLRTGKHRISVHNYKKRESLDVGFTVEMEFQGEVKTFSYPHTIPNNQTIPVCTFHADGDGATLTDFQSNPDLTLGTLSKEIWSVKTEEFHEVNAVVLSPNYWQSGNQAGNLHWFFLIDRCHNPEPTRGFYNEFLRPDLHTHRKVFEILASKMMIEPAERQLSGLGFSSTIRNSLVLRVQDISSTRTYKVKF